MGRDRRANLIVTSSVKGLINYSEFDSNDIYHLIREKIVLGACEADICSNLLNLKYIKDSILSNCDILKTETRIDKLKDNAALYAQLTSLAAPWIEFDKAATTMFDPRDSKSLQERWENLFGKLDSPEVQAKLASLKKQNSDKSDYRLKLN